jgi:alginate O-acetyltransferase complex protein AlgI
VLFNSFAFIFAFLPITVIGYELLRRTQFPRATHIWLIAASAVFYAYWNAAFLGLLFVSIVVNFLLGRRLQNQSHTNGHGSRLLLVVGLVWNLGLLGYFKYANFFVDNVDAAFGLHIDLAHVILPIGISFFTFQKVAFLVDSYSAQVQRQNFTDFCLFVMFFPQLIAGPIVHYSEVMPQFARPTIPAAAERFAIGTTIFALGLAKKVLIADTFSVPASGVFDAAAAGQQPGLLDSWLGTLSYTFQIYFDFSGYSDMAVGLAWLFGIRLPINFASPYKAASIAEFWQRWHITLSRFLKDYLDIPLGGNRRGPRRTYVNLLLTMLLGGIWHGAAWTFLLWGALHGAMLAGHRLWQETRFGARHALGIWLGRSATFICVVLAWVPFRAADFSATRMMYRGLFGGAGMSPIATDKPLMATLLAAAGLAGVWLLPNTYQWLGPANPGLPTHGYPATYAAAVTPRFSWYANPAHAVVFALLLFCCFIKLNDVSPFIYFQF